MWNRTRQSPTMLDKLKHWTQRILDQLPGGGCGRENRCYHSYLDLHRPQKIPILDLPQSHGKGEEEDSCKCHNCKSLGEIVGECPICLESYGTGVAACDSCSNIMCVTCAVKLSACPFCRHPTPPSRHPALDRILAKLRLPCSYARFGCKKILETRERVSHEALCLYSPVTCPVGKPCKWEGEAERLATHLEESHSVALLQGSGITVEIAGFRRKVQASNRYGRKYAVYLSCYSAVFLCRISLHERRLRLVLSEVARGDQENAERFGAWLEVKSSSRTMKGIMPVSSQPHKYKELQISCDSLLSPCKVDSEDTVKISITIRHFS